MPGLLRIGYKRVVNDKSKFAALIVGITFAVFLMIMMTSIFSGILRSTAATVTNVGVSQPSRQQFDSAWEGGVCRYEDTA